MKHLLIVEDDPDHRLILRTMFEAEGYQCEEAMDGQGALSILSTDQVGLVLTDLNMPRMNGIQFLTELRQDPLLKKTIVFVLTTSKRDEDKAEAYDLNVAGYIVKETAGHDFLELIGMVDNYWRLVELP